MFSHTNNFLFELENLQKYIPNWWRLFTIWPFNPIKRRIIFHNNLETNIYFEDNDRYKNLTGKKCDKRKSFKKLLGYINGTLYDHSRQHVNFLPTLSKHASVNFVNFFFGDRQTLKLTYFFFFASRWTVLKSGSAIFWLIAFPNYTILYFEPISNYIHSKNYRF